MSIRIRIEVNGVTHVGHPEFATVEEAEAWCEEQDFTPHIEGDDIELRIVSTSPEEEHDAFAGLTMTKWLDHQTQTEMIGHRLTADEVAGFRSFFAGFGRLEGPDVDYCEDFHRGRVHAERICYAQGVINSHSRAEHAEGGECPYAQFSAAWESWSDGYNDEGSIHRA